MNSDSNRLITYEAIQLANIMYHACAMHGSIYCTGKKKGMVIHMYKEIPAEIVRILVDSPNEYVTAKELAGKLDVSRRTVFNNMQAARDICRQNESDIISVKSKGYSIRKSAGICAFAKKGRGRYVRICNQEYKLYIIYLLLSDEEPVHISELENILYLSRPTVYRLVEEIKEWFAANKMELMISRKGMILETGEKRLRAAIKNWMMEAGQWLDGKKEGQQDSLKLGQCVKEFLTLEDGKVRKTVEEICSKNKLVLSQFELSGMVNMLQVMIYRLHKGHCVKISDRLFSLMMAFFSERGIKEIMDCFGENLNIQFPEREIVYFMVLLLNNGNFEDRRALDNQCHRVKVNEMLMDECGTYLKEHLNIRPEDFDELLADIEFIIKREVLFQIKGETGRNSKHYNAMTEKYRATVIMAQELYRRITKYYNIEYYEKAICNIAFSILSIIQKNKKELHAALIHNCDIFEFKFVLLSLQSLPFIHLAYATDSMEKLEEYLGKNEPDIIISTMEYKNQAIPVMKISKVFGEKETTENIRVLNQLYQRLNYERLMKNRIEQCL